MMAGFVGKLGVLLGGGRVAAVEFDRRHLRLVESTRSAGVSTVRRLQCLDMPDDMDLSDPQPVGKFIGRSLREIGLGGAALLMNIPRGQAVLKPLSFPPGTAEADLPGMVLYQMESDLPFPVADAVIDFTVETHYAAEPTGQNQSESVDVLVAAVRLEVVDYYRRVASAAGCKLYGLGLRSYSNLRCLRGCLPGPERDNEGLALVNLTADDAEIDVVTGPGRCRLSFSRSVTLLASGDDDPDARVRAVVTETARSLRSYQTLDSGGRVDRAIVAGGTGIEERVAEELARRLGVRCDRFNPAEALGLTAGSDASGFLPALGLAAEPDSRPLDFLAPKRPPVKRDTRKLRTAAIVAGAVLLLAGLYGGRTLHLAAKSRQLSELNERIEDNKPLVASAQDLNRRVDQVDVWLNARRDWLVHWAHVTCLFPSATDAYATSLRTVADGRMALEVRARRAEVIDEIRRRLTEAGYGFTSSGVSTVTDDRGYIYSAVIDLRIPSRMEVDLSAVEPVPRPDDDIGAGRGER